MPLAVTGSTIAEYLWIGCNILGGYKKKQLVT